MSQGSKTDVAVVSLLVLVITATVAVAERDLSAVKSIIDLSEKLDNVADGRALNSGITYADLEWALKRFNEAPETIQTRIKASPWSRIVLDFALNPLNYMGDELAEDPEIFALHLIRVETAYKRFRSAYAGEQIGDGQIYVKILNSEKLYDLFRDPKSHLTMLDFKRGRMEANNWRARLEELTTVEDIFSCLDELQSILNYFNFELFKPLFDHVYPALDNYNDPEEVRKLYMDELWNRYRIKFRNGNPVKIVGGRQQAKKPGFTDVVDF